MEINGNHPILGSNSDVQRTDSPRSPQPENAKIGAQNVPVSEDRVELSVRGLEQLVQSAPDVRDARVDELRQAIDRGTYNVAAEHVADKIITGSLLDEVF